LDEKIDIGVDGGINDKTIVKAKKVGANIFTVGSYFQKAENPRETFLKLKTKL